MRNMIMRVLGTTSTLPTKEKTATKGSNCFDESTLWLPRFSEVLWKACTHKTYKYETHYGRYVVQQLSAWYL